MRLSGRIKEPRRTNIILVISDDPNDKTTSEHSAIAKIGTARSS